MKSTNLIQKTLTAILVVMSSQGAWAQGQAPRKNLNDDFQNLGDNKAVVERVRRLDSQQRIRVVQNRTVDRNNRIELSAMYNTLSGADTYVQTQNVGGMLSYHFTPRWSVGIEYQKSYNVLTSEGKRQYDLAYQEQLRDPASPQRFAAVDYPLSTTLASVSFYPIYGKMNVFDWTVVQFDLYTMLGAGKKTLSTGETDVLAVGLGTGIWLNSWLTARLEVRYEKYKDLLTSEQRDQNALTALASLGVLVW